LYGADRRGDELPDWVADKQKRLEKIRQAKAELEAEARAEAEAEPDPCKTGHKAKPTGKPEEKTQRNFTDAESRIMKSRDGFIQGYNGQAAVDAESQVIVAQLLTNNGSDTHQMEPLLKQIRRNLHRQAKEISADSGYCCAWNLKRLRQRHIRGYVATDGQKQAINRWVQQMRQRLKKAGHRSRYRLRKQTVEPVFGQIKFARGFWQFLLRGIEKVSGEWSLLCTAHNLLKLVAVKG
jgi:ATP-dependent Clp protease ATP-binding subunit ClpA